MRLSEPSDDELRALEKRLAEIPGDKQRDSARFAAYYAKDDSALVCRKYPVWRRDEHDRILRDSDGAPVPSRGRWRRKPITRRQWIERMVRIRDANGQIVPLLLNSAQRRLEARMLLQERAGLPVRVLTLKSRKTGFSTYSQAVAFEDSMRGQHRRALVVAHDDDTSSMVLQMAHTMLNLLPRASGAWKFDMKNQAQYLLSWNAPQHGEIKIASANEKDPGRGYTPSMIHVSEMAFWPEAARKVASLFTALPEVPGTIALVESTANGDSGEFRDRFWNVWKDEERGVPLDLRAGGYAALFVPWYEDQLCRFSLTRRGTIPDELIVDLERTLTDHEKWLMRQTYVRRWTPQDRWQEIASPASPGGKRWTRIGAGQRRVDVDQLLYRRYIIAGKYRADPTKPETWGTFQSEYPATPEEAFLNTGDLIFDGNRIKVLLEAVRAPLFRGSIIDKYAPRMLGMGSGFELTGENQPRNLLPGELAWSGERFKLLEEVRGGLEIWQNPEPGRLYVVGVDTSGGSMQGDFAVAAVVETATRALVALWAGRYDPTSWGRMCASLALYYQQAMLAFETHPSPHGLSAALAARDMGYPQLYRRRNPGSINARITEELGFATTSRTKPWMADRVRVALGEGYDIPSADLLRQLKTARRAEDGLSIQFQGHDDLFVAFAIAQLVADDVGMGGYVSRPDKPAASWTEAWWAHRKRSWETEAPVGFGPRPPMYDGC